jgi:hypothetical protein
MIGADWVLNRVAAREHSSEFNIENLPGADMRHEVAIALIICGTALALAPPLSDHFQDQQIAQLLLERKDFNSVSLGILPMSSQYRFGCWALGAVMIGVGIASSRRGKSCCSPVDDDVAGRPTHS